MIKNERNKCVNLIQTSTQRAAEMREKIKILQNEIEILRTAAGAKERWEANQSKDKGDMSCMPEFPQVTEFRQKKVIYFYTTISHE